MRNQPPSLARKWSSQVEFIRLRHPLKVRITQSATGAVVKNLEFNLLGDGNTIEHAMDMLVEKLILDYYEFGLNPGPQSESDRCYGDRVRKLFTSAQDDSVRDKKLLNFRE